MAAPVMSAGGRHMYIRHGIRKIPNLVILLSFGFICAIYAAWQGLAIILETVQKDQTIARTDEFDSSGRRRGSWRFMSDSDTDPPLNIEFQAQLDHALPEHLHSVFSTALFSSVALLPLNASFIDHLFENSTSPNSDFAHDYAFGMLPVHWPVFRDALLGVRRGSEQPCRLVSAGPWCLRFRCFISSTFEVTLHRMYNQSNYWITRACDNYSQIMAFQMHKLSAYLTSSNVTILLPHDLHLYQAGLRYASFMPCDYRSSRAYRDKYGRSNDTSAYIPDSSVLNLASLRDLLHALRMTPFVCGGTLLGWKRECGIISYTSDFDFCVPFSQYNAGLEAVLANHAQFTLKYRFGKPSDGLEYTVYDQSGVRIDIFFLYEESNHSWVGGMGPGRMKLKYSYPKVARLCTVDLLGHLFHAPCNADDFIVADYGPNWTEPIHQDSYVWYYSSHSVTRLGYWPEEEADEVEKIF